MQCKEDWNTDDLLMHKVLNDEVLRRNRRCYEKPEAGITFLNFYLKRSS
jgi:hypothetical protein